MLRSPRLVQLTGAAPCAKLRRPLRADSLFFFQAEDGIRDATVTGVQTCALPIFVFAVAGRDDLEDDLWGDAVLTPLLVAPAVLFRSPQRYQDIRSRADLRSPLDREIGRASCRERVEETVGAVAPNKRTENTALLD